MKKRIPYLPLIVASLIYFAGAILFSHFLGTPFLQSALVSLVVYLIMTTVVVTAARLHKAQEESNSKFTRFLFGRTSKELADQEIDANTDLTDPTSDLQESFRQQARIEGMQREAQKIQDRVLRLGAVISVALVVYAAIMNLIFGFSPVETYLFSLPVVAVLWLLQIAFLPRWATYTSFFVFCGVRFGIATFGPQILMFLPNIIFLPIFYLLMMVFMFGSIMIPNLQQVKYFRPLEGTWEVPKGSTRGQFLARGEIDTQIDRFKRYSKGETDVKPTRGMIFEGPPGTGKTLFAKEIASDPELKLPIVISDASAFNAPFMGFGQLIPLIVRAKTEAMAREYGGAVVFIDEGENLFGARAGLQQQPSQSSRDADLWDVIDWQHGCQVYDLPHVRTRLWNEQQITSFASQLTPPTSGQHNIFMMPGAGGGSAAIYPFLTWMSGTNSPPFMTKFVRSKVNTLLSALFVPVTAFGKTLRLPPGKPQESNVMFITATNRFFMFDPAMIRPGRFGIVANFVNPDEDERADIAEHYLKQYHAKGHFQEDLIKPQRIREFAQATPNASPAEIEQMIQESVDSRSQHVATLRRLKKDVDDGRFDLLVKRDKKFWLRHKNSIYDANGQEVKGWDDEKVDWQALMETRSKISFGRTNPEATSPSTRLKVAFHEFGHFLVLKVCNGLRLKPTLLTVLPRKGTAGMVAYIPVDSTEMHPQDFYEGAIRTSVASWVTEHFFFGQNLPGVSGDLRNATNVAALMIGKFGMRDYDCTDEEKEYYLNIGETLFSLPETNMFSPQAAALIETVLRNPRDRANVATIIGMAAIDAYRLIRKNKELFLEVVPELLELDEFSGNKLTDLWNSLDTKLVNLEQMDEEDRHALPQRSFATINPFYGSTRAEGADIYEAVVATVQGVIS